MFIVKMAEHDGNHRYLVEKNVPIVFILPSRWQDGAESLRMDCTSCLWFGETNLSRFLNCDRGFQSGNCSGRISIRGRTCT